VPELTDISSASRRAQRNTSQSMAKRRAAGTFTEKYPRLS